MADADDTENSGDSDATEGETNEEEGDGSDETTDDNETPVTDPTEGDQDAEDNENTDAETPDEAPIETPAEEPEPVEDEIEGDELEAPDAVVMEEGATTAHTITVKVMNGDAEAADAAVVEFTEGSVDGTGDDKKVKEQTPIKFTVTPADDYVLVTDNAVAVKIGSEDKTADVLTKESDGSYTIKNGADQEAIGDNVTITVNVTDKTYTVNAPGTENSVSWKIKDSASTEEYSESSVKVKKGASVKLQATLAENADPVDVTVGTEKKSLTAESKVAEFTVALADLTGETDGSYKITAAYVVKKAEAEVTVLGKDGVALGTDFTAKYSIQEKNADDEPVFGAYKDVPETGKIAAHEGDVIAFVFTAKDKGDTARTIKSVMFGAADSTTPATTETDEETGETHYEVTVAKPAAADAAKNNIVTVELEETNVITIKKAADAKIAKVEYNTDNSTYKPALVTTDGWKVETTASSVTFRVTAQDHNKVSYIHKGTGEHKDKGCTDMVLTSADKTEVVTTDGLDASANGETLTIATEQIIVEYTLAAEAPEGVTVAIQNADGTAVAEKAADTEGDNTEAQAATPKTYVLNDGEEYFIKITGADNKALDLTKISSVKLGEESLTYRASKEAFPFKAAEKATAKAIAVTFVEAQGYNVTVMMDETNAENADYLATIQADAYQKGKATTDTQAADASPRDITADGDGNNLSYASVWEDTDFSFALKAKGESFKVTKVEASTDSSTWTELTAENGKYTLKAIKAATTIKVTTDFDPTTAYSIKFVDADGNVQGIVVDYAGAEKPETIAEIGKTNYLKKAADAKVSFKVTAHDGYTVDKVTFGTGETDVLTASNGVYTYDKFSDTAKAAEIKITTKATALSADKFVKFTTGENVTLKVTSPADIKPDEKGVYKLTKEAKEGETVKTPEISELSFDLIVPYGYTLAQITDNKAVRATTEKRVKSEDGNSWVYSYKVVANLLTGTNELPDSISTGDAAQEMVDLKLATGSETLEFKSLPADDPAWVKLTASGDSVAAGATVILKVLPGQTLKVDGKDVTKDLDGSYKYSFVAKLDDDAENASTVEIEVKNTASYKIEYAVDPDEEDSVTYETAGKDAIEAKIGSKVFIQLTDDEDQAVAIENYKLSEGAKSTYKEDETNTNQAVITVADADLSVNLYVKETVPVGTIQVEKEVLAGTITIAAKDAAGKTLTANGIKNKGTIKLDATTETSYALTLKEGRTTLNAGEYDEALAVSVKTADESSANSDAVKAVIDDGKLYLRTIKAEKAVVTISAKGAEDTPLLTFTVDGQKPKLKVKNVSSNNQGINEILLDVAADASVKPVADDFDLYYEVTVAQKEGSPSTTKKDGVYYLDAKQYDAKGKFAPVSQMFKVNGDTADKAAENTYTFTVRLVAVAQNTSVTVGTPEDGVAGTALTETNVKFASETSMAKEFKTRPAYYEDKLGVTKKTTKFYSGQDDVVVAVPKFSKKASHITDIEAIVYNKDGSLATGIKAQDVDLKTMEVKVDSGDFAAGSYDVVIYATATTDTVENVTDYNMYRASVKVPITVQKSINYIDVDYPSQLAMVADKKGNKKDVSITLKPVGIYEYDYPKNVKAQTQKFSYKLLTVDEDGNSYLGNPKNADKVIVKNNKITVKKDFIIGSDPEDNSFSVLVSAADWDGNGDMTNKVVTITVNDKALEIASVKLVDDDGKALPQTVTTEQIDYARVVMTDTNGQRIPHSLVILTPNKGKIYVATNEEDGVYVKVNGYQKNLTVKATTKDGGKKSCSSVKYTINYPTGLTYAISGQRLTSDARGSSSLHPVGDRDYTYMSKGNDEIYFYVATIDAEGIVTSVDPAHYNYGVKVEGGKVTSDKEEIAEGDYYIAPNKDTVKVTITDKTKKGDKGVTYTFKDNNWQTAAAPKASTKDKLYAARAGEGNCASLKQNLVYTVTKNNGYDTVKLSKVSGVSISGVSPIVTIGEGDTFTLKNVYATSAGTAKYAVVYGNTVDDTFYPKTKAGTLSIKVNKPGNVKAVTSYTINPNVSMGVKLEAKNAPVAGMVKFNKVVSANVNGNKNQFYDYFEVADGKLQIKQAKRTADGLAALAALDKKELTGYLEYQFASNTSGKLVVKQDKITVKISDKALPRYAASAVNIAGTNNAVAKTTVTLGNEAVNIVKVVEGEGNTENWKATIATGEGADGKVTLTAVGEPKAGKVDLYVIPADSKNTAVTSTEDIRKFGVKVQVTVNVKKVDDSKAKLTFAKGSATPVANINGSKVDLTVTLTEGKDFTYNLSNEAITAAAKTSAEGITNANDKKAAEAVNSVTFKAGTDGEKDTITFVLDRDKLDGNKVYKVPADLTFTSTQKATITFSVKTQKIPTMDDITKLVGDALKDFGVTKANYNKATEAAAEVKAAADQIEIPALSGIKVLAVAADDPTKFGNSGEGDAAVVGDHKIKVTLTDVTRAEGAEGKTADVIIVVTEKAEPQKADGALKAAITGFAVPDAEGKVPTGKTAVPTTQYALQAALQSALDNVAKNMYVVKVTDFKVTRDTPAAGGTTSAFADTATEGRITQIVYTYEVRNAMTGKLVNGMGSTSKVTVTGATTDIEGTTTEPEKPEVTVDSVTISVVGATEDQDITVEAGKALNLTASVLDTDNNEMSDVTVEWTVTGKGDQTSTEIKADADNSKSATLTVDSNEEDSKELTVTATVDGKSDSVTVKVTKATTTTPDPTPDPDEGGEEA